MSTRLQPFVRTELYFALDDVVIMMHQRPCDRVPRQVGELGANALSPFQRLGEAISSGVAGQLESLKSGAQGAVEGAQTQLGQSVTETIGNPLQARLCIV